ncbi:MAG: FtsX-like permease family protein [Candidatus Bathyarchaeota archaeon]|nr:FtsX-like permease family protein [Candidatus Bathyarchaeota archaeon]
MRLGFRYLRFRHLLVLAAILVLTSTLFSVTALSFLGFYKSFNAYLGEDSDIVAVYNVQSRTPFTGIIPASLTSQVGAMEGVLACSPEVLTPCVVGEQSFFVRGVLFDEFEKLSVVRVVEGRSLKESGVDSMLLGKNLAARLKVGVGDRVFVLGGLADRYLELQVVGVFFSGSSLDDEALMPLNVGQWLRGTSYNHVTLIRVKVNPAIVNSAVIYQELAKNASSTQSSPSQSPSGQASKYQEIVPWSTVNYQIGQIGVGTTQNLMKSYLDRYGVTEQAILVLAVVVFMFSGVTVVIASKTFVLQHRTDFATLRSLGASRRTLKLDILCKLLPLSLVASALGMLLSGLFLSLFDTGRYLQVLSHQINMGFDPLIVALNFILILVLVILSISGSDLY